MPFALSQKSIAKLFGVKEPLANVVKKAILISKADFNVFEGLRTIARQRQLVAAGASRTMDSYHITGEAVDLVPYVGGELRWDWPLCYKIARAMKHAAIESGTIITWGGVWDRYLNSLSDDMELECAEYVKRYKIRHPNPDDSAFIDGPHFQLYRDGK